MTRWLPKVLTRIRDLASGHRVAFTLKARRELASLGLGLDEQDASDVLAQLNGDDSAGRRVSRVTGEWMYIFKPSLGGTIVYVKIILRSNCIVVSFHEDEGGSHEEDDA